MSKKPIAVPVSLPPLQSAPHQMNMTFDTVELQVMSPEQRTNTVKRLAGLLIQAAGIVKVKEYDDDER
jgi:hypothetical protein